MAVTVSNCTAAVITSTTVTPPVAVSATTTTAALMECTSTVTLVAASAPEDTVHLDSTRILPHASANVTHTVVMMRFWTATPVSAEGRASIQMCSAPLCSTSTPASMQSPSMEYLVCKFYTSIYGESIHKYYIDPHPTPAMTGCNQNSHC